jgi:hypothetical protein
VPENEAASAAAPSPGAAIETREGEARSLCRSMIEADESVVYGEVR